MSTFNCSLSQIFTIAETLSGEDLSSPQRITHDGFNVEAEVLTGTSTVDVTVASMEEVTMSAGAATLDLTAAHLNGAVVTHSGLKPRWFVFRNESANDITVSKGASNGYTGLGASFSLLVKAGGQSIVKVGSAGVAVSGSVKTLDISGTLAQSLQVGVISGPT